MLGLVPVPHVGHVLFLEGARAWAHQVCVQALEAASCRVCWSFWGEAQNVQLRVCSCFGQVCAAPFYVQFALVCHCHNL